MTDRDDSDRATATPVEGVRIIGAKETPAARDDDRPQLDLSAVADDDDVHEARPSFTHRSQVPVVGTGYAEKPRQ